MLHNDPQGSGDVCHSDVWHRELFYNNVEGFISSGFPVLRELLDDKTWHAMVRDFFSRHRCKTPYFLEISAEFLDYLENERDTSDDPPFIKELAHYEWAELALTVAEQEIDETGIEDIDDFKKAVIKYRKKSSVIILLFRGDQGYHITVKLS